ncbi:hypothetical protein GXP67_21085 [Rhodocytophaga rosea]|uniref:Uncharacterized protein n=1 Tax=Rhodocytophaga rosea TaxID=2704465 RepID=A0A6C0GLR3_9BACT|nr:hypothetical protein [Rhodocytophaga rosea]QHT68965.1 hypothetical protein GXP67_21085 [Rhodocytophaga rosea]
MKKYLKLLNTWKKRCEVDNEQLSVLIDHKMTSGQIELALNGEKSLFTRDNIELIESALMKVSKTRMEELSDDLRMKLEKPK